MFLKSFTIVSVILLGYMGLSGQSAFPYDREWKLVDSLMNKKNLPKSALVEVNKIYAAAKKDKQEAQWVKAIIYKNHLQETDDRNITEVIAGMENEIAVAPPRVAAVLKSVEAELLFQYLQGHRYQMRNRTELVADTSADLNTWTIGRLSRRIRILYLSYGDHTVLLQQTPLNIFDPVLVKGNARALRPTLYDLLAWRALDYFRTSNGDRSFSPDDKLLENPVLFSEGVYFMHYGFPKTDSVSNVQDAISIYQQLLRFHSKDLPQDAWIDADISRIQYVYQNSTLPDKDSLYLNALARSTNQYGTLSVSSTAWWLQAQWWADRASSYDPLTDSLHRYDYLKAVKICEQVLKHPDSSEGKMHCEQLLREIKRLTFSIETEQVNLPDQPFRAMVSFKNLPRFYGRIIRIDDATRNELTENYYDLKTWSKLTRLPFERTFTQSFPETGDYQLHRVEVKINALPLGQYALITSSDSTFSNHAFMGLNTFFCSSIAFVKNGLDYFVVDRNTGQPMKGVRVKSFTREYNNNGIKFKPLKTYQSDVNGYFHVVNTDNTNQNFEFYLGKDYLATSQNNYYYRSDYEDDEDEDMDRSEYEEEQLMDFIFTDRSIYRPGQTVNFKGILVTRDFKTRKFKSVGQKQTSIFLKDVNGQKIDSINLKSNDFGTFRGSFKLPQGLLNGIFTISDPATDESQEISVEEYKRPTFYVDYDSIRASYKIGDSIKLSGSAKAYAGNSIGSAKLSWRVYRQTRYPYPWLFRFYPSSSETEVGHGESVTDAKGQFRIVFYSSPDKKVNRLTRPVYTYNISVTITDANGESRTADTEVAASYQSFEIKSSLALQSSIPRDSLYQIPVTTVNAAGLFVKEKLTVTLYKLETPSRLIRGRYWKQPDQFVMTENEFLNFFPNDEYRDETNIKSWKQGPAVFEKSDSSSADGLFAIGKNALASVVPGWYVLVFSARDNNGEAIVDKKYVEVTGNDTRPGSLNYNLVLSEQFTGEPGSTVNLLAGSAAKDLFVIRAKQVQVDTATKFSFFRMSQEMVRSKIVISESDRGGFAINDVFVKNNRWYSSTRYIQVPWTNKELHISYQTWKDKTLPGSREQWKINIRGSGADQLTSEVLTSMYDASLDQFKKHAWALPPIYPIYNRENRWYAFDNFNNLQSRIKPTDEIQMGAYAARVYDAFINFSYGKSGNRMQSREMSGALATVTPGLALNDVVVTGYSTNKKESNYLMPEAKTKDGDLADENIKPSNDAVQVRRNFNETAFFQPDLKTDAQGNVEISFTMPDALTRWKWMVLANTKDLAFGYSEKQIITQKELMVQTNMPRFFREGDTMQLPVKITNLSDRTMTGTVQLEWMDADNSQITDQAVGNIKGNQTFTVEAAQSGVVFFTTVIPAHFTRPLLYRVIAKTNLKGNEYSDGEENIIPVLSNRMLVTESLPLNMEGKADKHFSFEKLLKSSASSSLQNQSLTIEYTTHPAWYAVQSLPFLMEFPYECAEQTFNRFYANALAAHIVRVSPVLQTVFEKWRNTDTAALLSNLQKNEELKMVLLRETPWVLQAESESQQKKNIALLFDLIKMRQALKSTLDKLQQMQSETGAFAWFKGGRDDRYITQYIIAGIGRLRKLKAVPADLQAPLDKMARSGIAYLDKQTGSDYQKRDKSPAAQNLDPVQIQYLYMRSFFSDVSVPGSIFTALNYYRKLSVDKWMKQSVYMQGMIALFLNRTGDIKTAKDILASLKENSSTSSELGMYWRTVVNGYYWQQAPVETQSLLIEVFQELHADKKIIDQMKYWLLQQKRTTHWPTTKATADACYALLLNGTDWLVSRQTVSIRLGNYKINSSEEKTEAGTGYFKKQIPGIQVQPEMGNIDVNIQPEAGSKDPGQAVNPSWGAVYWQYFENLDKITSAETQLSLSRNLFIEKNSDRGPVLEAVSATNKLKPGDKLKMRIIIKTDRDLEYVHLKDMRAACLEPVNVLSGYQWQGGLGYYQTTKDASTSFFFDRLPKGIFVFEYAVFVTTSGNYSNGISSLECMYAPEFAAHSEGIRLQVESK